MEANGTFIIRENCIQFVKVDVSKGKHNSFVNFNNLKNLSGYFHTHNLHVNNKYHYHDIKERFMQNNVVKIIQPSTTDIITHSKAYKYNKNWIFRAIYF